ncbi:MAG TPA: CoA pyrophosphatase [Gemmatimonadaceae bacterium]|nr:CoA pyrophosphatase [Gemmatimonadaceae bacterium]
MTHDPRLTHPRLVQLAGTLAARPGAPAADDGAPARAAVALTLRPASAGLDLLLIRRAERAGDPWSGQIALPGGRWSPNDESLLHTALRETWEETGVDLAATGVILGTLDELRPRTATLPPIIVTPVVVALDEPVSLRLSDEVAEAFWVPLDLLQAPETTRESQVQVRGATWKVPSFVLREHVVWGMTERILRQLLSRLG